MIQIIHGDIFDAKCDLLIVPCNSDGGVTHSVYSNLRSRGLPVKIGRIPYGRVHFVEVHYEFASTVGYAASVRAPNDKSDVIGISQAAKEILKYARENDIRVVNIPLLGSGAGGMTPIESFQSLASVLADVPDLQCNIYCYSREAFRNVSAVSVSAPLPPDLRHPRVFISYAGNDKENALWTKRLAESLRSNGVDARIDVFHLRPGFDLPQWMTNEVVMADKVLLVCDKFYAQKADIHKGGVGWETMIIQGDMLAQGDNKQKYIAIIRGDEVEKSLPIYMRSKYALNWDDNIDVPEEKLQELVLLLFDCDAEPEIGAVPTYVVQALAKKQKV